MNKRIAIRECKKLWDEIEKSGLSKVGYLKLNGDTNDCPLCEYTIALKKSTCYDCPLKVQYGRGCYSLGYDPNKRSSTFFDAIRGLN